MGDTWKHAEVNNNLPHVSSSGHLATMQEQRP